MLPHSPGLSLALPLALLTGCGGPVDGVDGGVGGQSGATTSSTSSTKTALDCTGSIEVTSSAQAPIVFTSACADAVAPGPAQGWMESGGAAASSRLRLQGCASAAEGSAGLHIDVAPASGGVATYFVGATARFVGDGGTWGMSGDPVQVDVTSFEPEGGQIQGTSVAVLMPVGATGVAPQFNITFSVCHAPDVSAP
jgi:hypothetical protein